MKSINSFDATFAIDLTMEALEKPCFVRQGGVIPNQPHSFLWLKIVFKWDVSAVILNYELGGVDFYLPRMKQ